MCNLDADVPEMELENVVLTNINVEQGQGIYLKCIKYLGWFPKFIPICIVETLFIVAEYYFSLQIVVLFGHLPFYTHMCTPICSFLIQH